MKKNQFIKFTISIFLVVFIMATFAGCIGYGYVPDHVLKHYDLSDEKISAEIDENGDFEDDMVIVTLKKSPTKYNPTVSDFAFYNIDYIEYLFEDSDRRILFVYLKQKGRDKVLEAVRYFDSLIIVRYVGVSGYASIE